MTHSTKKRKSERRQNKKNSRKQTKQNKTAKLHLKKNSRKNNKRGKQRKIFRRSKLVRKPNHYKRMVIPVDKHRIHQQIHPRHERRQRVNQIRTDRAPTRVTHATFLHKQHHRNLIDGNQKSKNPVENVRGEINFWISSTATFKFVFNFHNVKTELKSIFFVP